MAYVEVGNDRQSGEGGKFPPVQKWNSTGQTVEGVYRGQREGKFGPLMIVETSAGEVVYGMKAVLEKKLVSVSPGDKIKVEYLGKRKGANGFEYGDFKVLVDAQNNGLTYPGTAHPTPEAARAAEKRLDEFDRLVGLIKAAKGDGIANALAVAAKMSGDPVKSLREAMEQIGVVGF